MAFDGLKNFPKKVHIMKQFESLGSSKTRYLKNKSIKTTILKVFLTTYQFNYSSLVASDVLC